MEVSPSLGSLPDELLQLILHFCQPTYIRHVLPLWECQSHRYNLIPQLWISSTAPPLALTSEMLYRNGFHSTFVRSYKSRPLLSILSQVSFRFRNLVYSHRHLLSNPSMILHQRLRIQSAKTPLSRPEFIPMSKVKSLVLDSPLSLSDFKNIIGKIEIASVESLVLVQKWDLFGSTLLKSIASFSNLKRIYLKGIPTPSAFFGLDRRALRTLAKLPNLTHVFLDGFGGGSFSFSALLDFLADKPIEALSLGYVRQGINLDQLAVCLPNLRGLTIQFNVIEPLTHLDETDTVMNFIRRSRRVCVPTLQGGLFGLSKLEWLNFFDSEGSEELSRDSMDFAVGTLQEGHEVAIERPV